MDKEEIESYKHHKAIEEIANILCIKTNNTDRVYFNLLTAFFITKIASNMRAVILTDHLGEIPINMYLMAFATSGFGKGSSKNIFEEQIFSKFQNKFTKKLFNEIADYNLMELASNRAEANNTDVSDEATKIKALYDSLGAYPYTFDTGTGPALRQIHSLCGYSGIGAINFEMDEVGSNLLGANELFPCFLELYDKGLLNLKITKQTSTSKRGESLGAKVPSNMLLFGTATKIFDDPILEKEFNSLLSTGYARRCFFANGVQKPMDTQLTPEEVYIKLTCNNNNETLKKWNNVFGSLADPDLYKFNIQLNYEETLKLIEYSIYCQERANSISEILEIPKAEMLHRQFKCLKLAGALAFIDKSPNITLNHLQAAIKLTEESGQAFNEILNRENNYVRLAKFIVNSPTPLTHYDIYTKLPFYSDRPNKQKEFLAFAIQWGYANNVIIKQELIAPNVEVLSGETLKLTDLNELIISVSESHITYGYNNFIIPFNDLDEFGSNNGYQWCNHHIKSEHRLEANMQNGFNMVVLDFDGDCDMKNIQSILKEYTYKIYTTKSHTDTKNRFRLIIPIKYILYLEPEDYKNFINNIIEFIPYGSDYGANQRSRSWASNKGIISTNIAELFDPLKFLPNTQKNTIYTNEVNKLSSLDALEKYFALLIAQNGQRNNTLLRYALLLKDNSYSLNAICEKVMSFNKKLSNPLSENEIQSTIFKTISKNF